MQPIFHAAHIHDFVGTFATYARQMCRQWQVDEVRQLEQEMMALALQIICQTMFSTYALHRQESYYPEPTIFCPERFAPDAEQPPRYAYLPFGAGSRTCIGNAFAMLEIQTVMATMIQAVELSLVPDQEIVPEMLVTLRPRDGVKVCVEQVTQGEKIHATSGQHPD